MTSIWKNNRGLLIIVAIAVVVLAGVLQSMEPKVWMSIMPVSYTHLDVYKRQFPKKPSNASSNTSANQKMRERRNCQQKSGNVFKEVSLPPTTHKGQLSPKSTKTPTGR